MADAIISQLLLLDAQDPTKVLLHQLLALAVLNHESWSCDLPFKHGTSGRAQGYNARLHIRRNVQAEIFMPGTYVEEKLDSCRTSSCSSTRRAGL